MTDLKTTSYSEIIKCKKIQALALIFFVIFNIKALYSQNFWEKPFSVQNTSVYCITPGSAEYLFAGVVSGFSTTNNGVILSIDNGLTWNTTGLKKIDVLSIGVNSSGVVFAGTIQTGVYRSFDNGNTFG